MPTTRLAIASTFSCELIGRWLSFWLQRLGGSATTAFAGYGQLERELRSPLAFRSAECCIGLLRMEDWQRGTPAFDAARFEADLTTFIESLRAALAQLPRVVLLICPSRPTAATPTLAAATARLLELASSEPRLCVVDALEAARCYAVADVHDPVADELGHVPYTDPMWCALGAVAIRAALPALAPPLKLAIIDCDYTLWHHAVGEVGADGVHCEARHLELQQRLLALKERGVLLALCSRNHPDAVWQVPLPGSAHPRPCQRWPSLGPPLGGGGCSLATPLSRGRVVRVQVLARPPSSTGAPILRAADVSASRIQPTLSKAHAVASLCEQLQCAPESAIFIDDNPSECATVRAALPVIPCLCWPQTHAEAISQLAHSWRLDLHANPPTASAAGAKLRAESIGHEGLREALKLQADSPASYHSP